MLPGEGHASSSTVGRLLPITFDIAVEQGPLAAGWLENDILFQFTVDPEPQRFELQGSTYLQVFFPISACTVFDPQLGVPRCRGPAVCIHLCHAFTNFGVEGVS